MVSLAFLRFTSEMSLGWGVSLMLAKIDQIEAFLVKSLDKKISVFKTHFLNLFEMQASLQQEQWLQNDKRGV